MGSGSFSGCRLIWPLAYRADPQHPTGAWSSGRLIFTAVLPGTESSPVVLDTNVLVSALLFEAGRLAWLRHGWQSSCFTPVLAEPTTRELLRVLAYPKFRLEPMAIKQPLPPCGSVVRDPQDQVFLDLAFWPCRVRASRC